MLLLYSTLVFFSCQRNRDLPSPYIPPEAPAELSLQDYFQKFEEEGKARGYDVNLAAANITGTIEEIFQEYVAGKCFYSQSEVVIDSTFWHTASENLKEMAVFHELGHCYLKRHHEEGTLSDGTCKSIMQSGLGECNTNYFQYTRDYYIDELFFGSDF